jgi:hypothetical protein
VLQSPSPTLPVTPVVCASWWISAQSPLPPSPAFFGWKKGKKKKRRIKKIDQNPG